MEMKNYSTVSSWGIIVLMFKSVFFMEKLVKELKKLETNLRR